MKFFYQRVIGRGKKFNISQTRKNHLLNNFNVIRVNGQPKSVTRATAINTSSHTNVNIIETKTTTAPYDYNN